MSTIDDKVAETLTPPPVEPLVSDFDILESASQTPIDTHYGFLKELGLDFGWGPTAFMEWSFEHVHILLGTPWWLSIPITMLAARVLLFKTYVGSADMAGRMAAIKPHTKDIEARLHKAKLTKDLQAVLQASQEMRAVHKVAGIKVWKSAVPLINIPLGYGMFRLTRNMAHLPVPGLETGGTLWFYDLTLADPYFILPAITSAGTYLLFKLGGETGAAMANLNPVIMNVFKYVMPVVSFIFVSWWPAAMQMTFAFSSVMATTQAFLFRQSWFRNFWGIQPLPTTMNPTSPSPFKGMVVPTQARAVPEEGEESGASRKGLLGWLQDKGLKFVEKNQQTPIGRRTAAETKEAKRYEEKRRKEIDQAKKYRQHMKRNQRY
ncbi:MAG: hypothetical protein Q9218_007779 [Villophora microphyllina]